jgi:uncharacterized protein (DUF302 family)
MPDGLEDGMDNGIVTVASHFSVKETIDRLVATIGPLGLKVFARIDHAAGAAQAGFQLHPTELLIFGNPKGGTPLMLDQQIAGIDLPVKALAWEDAERRVWLSYNDPAWIAARHGLFTASADAVAAIAKGMAMVVAKATSAP